MRLPGYYSGLLLAAVMVGFLVSSRMCGLASDRYGCRFVMIFGLCATATLSLALGVSPTFGWAVGLRWAVSEKAYFPYPRLLSVPAGER